MGASGVLDMVTRYWTAQNLKTIRRGQVGAPGVGWSQVGPFHYCDGIENVALRRAVALMALVSRIVENHSSTITKVVHKKNALGISHWKSQEKHTMHRKSQVIQSLACCLFREPHVARRKAECCQQCLQFSQSQAFTPNSLKLEVKSQGWLPVGLNSEFWGGWFYLAAGFILVPHVPDPSL